MDFGSGLQQAIEAPRTRLWDGRRVNPESRIDAATLAELGRRGHVIEDTPPWTIVTGGMQAISRDPDSGVMVGAADPRREGQFDACAVALVSRICEVTGARIVVASSWRYTVGYKQTQMKLLEQGLPRTLFHEGWACPMARFSTPEKCDDITLWLEEHGITQTGSWLALDDEDIVPGATMTTDALDGLGAREAAAAVRYLGGADAGLGVRALSDSDMDLVRESFSGNRIAACRWLEGVDARAPRSQRPAALLTRDRREEVLRQLAVATGE